MEGEWVTASGSWVSDRTRANREERVELRSSGRSWSESDRGRGGKATSDRMVNERFFCNDRDAKQPFAPPEHTIDKGFGLVILASFADPSVTVALWHLRIVFGI